MVALISVMAACGSKALPDPGSGATVITVTANSPTAVTIRQGKTTHPLKLPGPITLDVGSALQLNLEELNGARAWSSPVSSNPDALKQVSSGESTGYLVVLFRAESPGTVSLRTPYPCSGTGCAAALFRVDIIIKSPRPS
jgi:hypothetical protein